MRQISYPPANGASLGNYLRQTSVAAKVAKFFEIVSVFEFMRDEAKNFRKNGFGGSRMSEKILLI